MTSKEFITFLEIRAPCLQKLVEIQLIETKDVHKVQELLQHFYRPIADMLRKQFLTQVKTSQIEAYMN